MGGVEVLEIVSPGILASVQDTGRRGLGRVGVAPSGAADSYACRMANLLVGNLESAAVVETTLMGFQARFLRRTVFAVTGADLQPELNGDAVPLWTAVPAGAGDRLELSSALSGCRAYVAVGGGVDLPVVMGSRATNIGAGFGGYRGRALQAGDRLPCCKPENYLHCAGRSLPVQLQPVTTSQGVLRALPGPQADQFPDAGRRGFYETVYTVSNASNRTGVRLDGPALEPKAGAPASILSEGILSGAVQVPGDGRPIVLMNETVTGGYRKIAVVIAADLPLLGQLAPGDTVRFQETTLDEALALLRGVEAAVDWVRGQFAD